MPIRRPARIALRLGLVLLALLGAYAAAGFLGVPRVTRSLIEQQLPRQLAVRVSVGAIHFNPFLFRLRIDGLHLRDRAGGRLTGFEHLLVDLEPASLLARRLSFGRIELTAPYVDVAVSPAGALNLAALIPPGPARPPTPAPAPARPLRVRVGLLRIVEGALGYEDASRVPAFATRLSQINVELEHFETGAEGGVFILSGASPRGERLEWRGRLALEPLGSEGTLHIEQLELRTIADYLGAQLPCRIDSGRADVAIAYALRFAGAPAGRVTLESLTLSDLRIGPRDTQDTWVVLPTFNVRDGVADLAERTLKVQSVELGRLGLTVWRKPDGTLNLLDLAGRASAPAQTVPPAATAPAGAPPAGASPAATAGTAAHAMMPAATVASGSAAPAPQGAATAAARRWQLEVERVDLRQASIAAADRSVTPEARLTLAPLTLGIEHVSLDPSRPVHVALDTRLNDTGTLSIEGEVTPSPASADLKVTLARFDLRAVQPYLAQSTAMTLRRGRLSLLGQVQYGARRPALAVNASVTLEDLHTVDDALDQDFINVRRLEVKGVRFTHAPDRLEVEGVTAREPYARVIIAPDSSLNVSRVLHPAAAAAHVSMPGKGGTAASAATAPPSPTRVEPSQPLPALIRTVRVQGGHLDFTDLSVTPNFSTGIRELEGSVTGLSSRAASRARVDLSGNVDAYSPVSIQGEVNLLSAALYTDLSMSFRNIELSIFNPYSGKFAGYNIAQGKLTALLHYKVIERRLDARHHIVIDQLEFGDKTSSKQAVSLPVRLAVALLKDRNGVIDLDLPPVGGTLDDPTFRIAPLVWKVLVNILEKAVTAPFALLGSLFGGGPELQFIDFDPGASALDPAAADKMRALVHALNERPQLKVELPIAAQADLDRPALLEAELEAPLRGLEGAARLKALTVSYQRATGAAPAYPPPVRALKGTEALNAKVEFLTAALRERLSIGDTELRALAEQRAHVLEDALLKDSGIDPGRVFLVANDKASVQAGRVRLELTLR